MDSRLVQQGLHFNCRIWKSKENHGGWITVSLVADPLHVSCTHLLSLKKLLSTMSTGQPWLGVVYLRLWCCKRWDDQLAKGKGSFHWNFFSSQFAKRVRGVVFPERWQKPRSTLLIVLPGLAIHDVFELSWQFFSSCMVGLMLLFEEKFWLKQFGYHNGMLKMKSWYFWKVYVKWERLACLGTGSISFVARFCLLQRIILCLEP